MFQNGCLVAGGRKGRNIYMLGLRQKRLRGGQEQEALSHLACLRLDYILHKPCASVCLENQQAIQ